MAQSEKAIVNSILAYLNDLEGCYAEKMHGSIYSQGGRPDITACYHGRRIELEVKRPGNKPTKRQLEMMRRWREVGAVVEVVYSVDDVRALMEWRDW